MGSHKRRWTCILARRQPTASSFAPGDDVSGETHFVLMLELGAVSLEAAVIICDGAAKFLSSCIYEFCCKWLRVSPSCKLMVRLASLSSVHACFSQGIPLHALSCLLHPLNVTTTALHWLLAIVLVLSSAPLCLWRSLTAQVFAG